MKLVENLAALRAEWKVDWMVEKKADLMEIYLAELKVEKMDVLMVGMMAEMMVGEKAV